MKKLLLSCLLSCLLLSPVHAVLLLDGNVPPGCTVSAGTLTCTGFVGDGSGLTSLPASDGNDTKINRLAEAVKASASSPVAGTTIANGDGNFTVDEEGNITYKSAGSVRTDAPQYVRLYEPTSKGNKYRQIIAPADGYTRGDADNETSFELPADMPTTGAGYMSLLWPALGTGETISKGIWAYGLYSTSPITGMVKTYGTQVVSAATAGSDYTTPSSTETFTNKTYSVAGTGNVLTTNVEYHPTATGSITTAYMPFAPGYLIDNTLCTDNCTLTMNFDCSSGNVGRSAVFMDDNATAPSRLIVRPSANNTILDYCTVAGKGVRIDKTDRSFLGLRCKKVGASTYNWVPYGQLGYHVCED